eukprot:Rmarinus@m.21113
MSFSDVSWQPVPQKRRMSNSGTLPAINVHVTQKREKPLYPGPKPTVEDAPAETGRYVASLPSGQVSPPGPEQPYRRRESLPNVRRLESSSREEGAVAVAMAPHPAGSRRKSLADLRTGSISKIPFGLQTTSRIHVQQPVVFEADRSGHSSSELRGQTCADASPGESRHAGKRPSAAPFESDGMVLAAWGYNEFRQCGYPWKP